MTTLGSFPESLVAMSYSIHALMCVTLSLSALSAGATEAARLDKSSVNIISQRSAGAGVIEVEVSKDFPVAQEMRRHYQTKSYSSEYMLSWVKCSNRQINVLTYRWYADARLSGALVYSSDLETGWYSADKDPASQELVAKVCA